MKTKEIILEASKNQYKPKIIAKIDYNQIGNNIAKYIKQYARPWLAQTNNGQLEVYRGVETSGRDGSYAYVQKIRKNRKPKDTDIFLHKAFNVAIAAAGGYANRSNSAFVTGDFSTAETYAEDGDVYVFIPLGNFRYTYSPHWYDWTEDVHEDVLEDLTKPMPITPAMLKRAASNIKEILSRYTSKSIKDAYILDKIKKFTDILNNPKKLEKYAKDFIAGDESNLLDINAYDPVEVKKYIVADRDLSRAIKSEVEIMIAADMGLYVNEPLYDRVVKRMLVGKKPLYFNPTVDNDDYY